MTPTLMRPLSYQVQWCLRLEQELELELELEPEGSLGKCRVSV